MEQPLVSVITPIYNCEKFLEKCILSVQNQTYCNWEMILIDDASTDGSSKIAKDIAAENTSIIYEKFSENKGAAVARNRAIELARGEFIAFLDADDFWAPDKLEVQVEYMLKNKCDVSFSSYAIVDEEGAPTGKTVFALPELSYNKLLRNNYVGNLTGMYHCKTLGKIYSPDLRKRQDWGLWLNALKKSNRPAMGIPLVLSYYRKRKNSMSTNKFALLKHNYLFYKKYLGVSTPKACYRMGIFLIEYFFVRPSQIKKYPKI